MIQFENFLGIEDAFADYEKAQTVIIPVPYEATTSYVGGTKNGPEAIIKASAFVELYDEELEYEAYRNGIFTREPLKFTDDVEADFDQVSSAFKQEIDAGKFVVGLGGEHSVSWPIYRAFHDGYKNISVLQLDAHSDVRDTYEGSPYSHACVMKRIYERNSNIIQLGIRSQCIEEADFIRENNIITFYAHQIRQNGWPDAIIDKIKENVFITIDVDFFDPSLIPATGTPEPGGFFWDETLVFLKNVFSRCNVVGFDVVELSPIDGLVHPDFTIAKLIYKLIGYKFYYGSR